MSPHTESSPATAAPHAPRARVLLVLTVLGFLASTVMVVVFFADHGFDLGLYFSDWFATLPSTQLAVDLAISFVAFVVWAGPDGRENGVKLWWVTVPAALLVGLCFAIPLYLLLRERALEALDSAAS
jgi:hypothetical protein